MDKNLTQIHKNEIERKGGGEIDFLFFGKLQFFKGNSSFISVCLIENIWPSTL